MSIITTAVILILIMDPIGNLASFRTMVHHIPPRRRSWIVLREMLIALIAMVLFHYIGEYVLGMLGISEPTVRLTSGIILFLIALRILFPTKDSLRSNITQEEPFVVPLAIPLIAGPALLATIMLYSITEPSQLAMLAAIIIAWVVSSVILLLSEPLFKLLGNNGLVAFERLLAMVLILLAIQRTLEGVQQFLALQH